MRTINATFFVSFGVGVEHVMINLHYLGEQIRHTLGDGSQWRMRLSYSDEPVLLGTGGGIKRVEEFFDDGPFLVLSLIHISEPTRPY